METNKRKSLQLLCFFFFSSLSYSSEQRRKRSFCYIYYYYVFKMPFSKKDRAVYSVQEERCTYIHSVHVCIQSSCSSSSVNYDDDHVCLSINALLSPSKLMGERCYQEIFFIGTLLAVSLALAWLSPSFLALGIFYK